MTIKNPSNISKHLPKLSAWLWCIMCVIRWVYGKLKTFCMSGASISAMKQSLNEVWPETVKKGSEAVVLLAGLDRWFCANFGLSLTLNTDRNLAFRQAGGRTVYNIISGHRLNLTAGLN